MTYFILHHSFIILATRAVLYFYFIYFSLYPTLYSTFNDHFILAFASLFLITVIIIFYN